MISAKPRDVHPHNKMDVGKRLALWALKHDYKQKVSVCSGPLYQSHNIKGDKVIITFDSAGSGLISGEKPVMDPARETGGAVETVPDSRGRSPVEIGAG